MHACAHLLGGVPASLPPPSEDAGECARGLWAVGRAFFRELNSPNPPLPGVPPSL